MPLCQAETKEKDLKRAIFDESEKPPLIKRLFTPLAGLVPHRDKGANGDPFIPHGEEMQRQLAAHLQQQSHAASTPNPWAAASSLTYGNQLLNPPDAVSRAKNPWAVSPSAAYGNQSRNPSGVVSQAQNPWAASPSAAYGNLPAATSQPLKQRPYPWPAPVDSLISTSYGPPAGNARGATSPTATTEPVDEIRQASLAGVVKPAKPPTMFPAPSMTAPPIPWAEGNRGSSTVPPGESQTAVPATAPAAVSAATPTAVSSKRDEGSGPLQFDDLPLAQAIAASVPPSTGERTPATAPPHPTVDLVPQTPQTPQTPLHQARITLPAREAKTPPPSSELDKGSRLLAIVGTQSILAGDLLGRINEVLAPYVGEAPPDELEAQREILMQQLLPRLVENKLVYMDFLRIVPPDKLPDVEKQASDLFHKEELPRLMKAAGVDTPAAYDAKLRKSGSSLLKRRREFMEQEFARTMIAKNVNLRSEVSHGEMLDYYKKHAEDYYQKARVRWERIMVSYDKFASRGEAYQAIASMGDQVVVKGIPFAEVARHGSHGPNAHEGGQHEWTEQNSLASEEIDRVLFSLPIGKMSRIIENGDGYHIVRVLERREAGQQPFAELQDEIRKKIVTTRRSEQIKGYLDKLKNETPVWTVFDQAGKDAGLRVGASPQPTSRY